MKVSIDDHRLSFSSSSNKVNRLPISSRHDVKEFFGFEFLEKSQVDELFRLSALGLRYLWGGHVDEVLYPSHGRIRLLGRSFQIVLIGVVELFLVVGTHIAAETLQCWLLVRKNV